MFGILKFGFYFFISVILLSFPYESKPLFYTLNKYSSPIAEAIISSGNSIFKKIKNGIEENSVNIDSKKIDKITSSLSSIKKESFKKVKDLEKRKKFFNVKNGQPSHLYDQDERSELRKILERE